MEVLTQSRSGFPVAGPLQEMLRKSANECAIRLPKNLTDLMAIPRPQKNLYKMDDLIDACTRPNYVQPVDEIRLRYLPSFAADWTVNASSFGFLEPNSSDRGGMRMPSAEERGAQSLMQIRNLLNTNWKALEPVRRAPFSCLGETLFIWFSCEGYRELGGISFCGRRVLCLQ